MKNEAPTRSRRLGVLARRLLNFYLWIFSGVLLCYVGCLALGLPFDRSAALMVFVACSLGATWGEVGRHRVSVHS